MTITRLHQHVCQHQFGEASTGYVCGAQVEEECYSQSQCCVSLLLHLLWSYYAPLQFKYFPMSFPSEIMLHVELKLYLFLVFSNGSPGLSFLPPVGHL